MLVRGVEGGGRDVAGHVGRGIGIGCWALAVHCTSSTGCSIQQATAKHSKAQQSTTKQLAGKGIPLLAPKCAVL